MKQEQATSLISQLLSPRNLIFAVMALATAAFVLYRPADSKKKDLKEQDLESRQFELVVKLFVHQAALSEANPDPAGRSAMRKQLVRSLNQLDTRGDLFRGERLLQKYILLAYIESNPMRTADPPALRGAAGYDDFVTLFRRGRPVAEGSVLFSAPTAPLTRIRQFRLQGRLPEADALAGQLRTRMMLFGFLAIMLGGGMFGLYVVAMILVIWRKPGRRYRAIHRLFVPAARRVFLEAVILHLFISLPLVGLLAGAVPDEDRLALAALGIALGFAASLTYAARLLGRAQLRLMIHAETAATVFKEVVVGLLGFAVIFPGAVAVLLFSIALFQPDVGVRAAHPLVHELERGFLLPFVLAAIVAPIVEETMFRGFLYGFMRNFFGALAAAFVTGLIFALLHPQGIVALPYLTVLGAGLAVLRELRPGLVACMTVHCLVNSLAVASAYVMLHF